MNVLAVSLAATELGEHIRDCELGCSPAGPACYQGIYLTSILADLMDAPDE